MTHLPYPTGLLFVLGHTLLSCLCLCAAVSIKPSTAQRLFAQLGEQLQ